MTDEPQPRMIDGLAVCTGADRYGRDDGVCPNAGYDVGDHGETEREWCEASGHDPLEAGPRSCSEGAVCGPYYRNCAEQANRERDETRGKIQTVADEAFGPFAEQSFDDNAAAIEKGIARSARISNRLRGELDEAERKLAAVREWANDLSSGDLREEYEESAREVLSILNDTTPAPQWTSEPPTVPGWYWWRSTSGKTAVTRVHMDGFDLCAWNEITVLKYTVATLGGEWHPTPIPAPREEPSTSKSERSGMHVRMFESTTSIADLQNEIDGFLGQDRDFTVIHIEMTHTVRGVVVLIAYEWVDDD